MQQPNREPEQRYLTLSVRQWLLLLIVLPGIPFLLTSLFILVYSNIPLSLSHPAQLPEIDEDTRSLILVIHGKDSTAEAWAEPLATDINQHNGTAEQQAFAIDWRDDARCLLRCSIDARQMGKHLARQLGGFPRVTKVHLIAHSAGSFVAYGFCEEAKALNPNLYIQTTYLAPVAIYGSVDWNFGSRHFGRCADLSDAYIDIEDKAPGSSVPLDYPHTFDVTRLRPKHFAQSPHLWPIIFYHTRLLSDRLPYWRPDGEVLRRYPLGRHTVLTADSVESRAINPGP